MTVAVPLSLAARIPVVDAWKYSLAEPSEGWTQPSFDDLGKQGIAGGVYTQATDVEGEINVLITCDRKAIKIPAADLATLHRRSFDSERRIERTVPD